LASPEVQNVTLADRSNKPVVLETERLLLRQWRDEDRGILAELQAEPELMQYIGDGHPFSSNESRKWLQACWLGLLLQPFGTWAAEHKAAMGLVGWAALTRANWIPQFQEDMEVGWFLGQRWWGLGLATEAGRACLGHGFEVLGLPRVLGIRRTANLRSGQVMDRLGMDLCLELPHPEFGYPMSVHEITRDEWDRM